MESEYDQTEIDKPPIAPEKGGGGGPAAGEASREVDGGREEETGEEEQELGGSEEKEVDGIEKEKKEKVLPGFPLSPEETVWLVGWLRRKLILNNMKVMWREMKIFFVVFGFLFFIQFFMFYIIPEDSDEMWKPLLFVYLSLPMLGIDFRYYNIYRFTLYYRPDMNYAYPALFDKRVLVHDNIMWYVLFNFIALIAYLFLIPQVIPHSDFSKGEARVIVANLFLIKMAFFGILNLIETRKRRDRFSDIEDILTSPLIILIMFFFGLFNFILVILILPEETIPILPALSTSSTLMALLVLALSTTLIWTNYILPYADSYWHEDRTPLPTFYQTPAAKYNTVFGEEVRELDRESDVARRFKIFDESRVRMGQRHMGIGALWEKCNVVFLRHNVNYFLSVLIPTALFTLILQPVLGEDAGMAILMIATEILVLFLMFTIAANNPLVQEPWALEYTRLLPLPSRTIIGWSIVQYFLAGLAGISLFIIIVNTFIEPIGIGDNLDYFLILLLSLLAGSILMSMINLHSKHNYYPKQLQRTASHAMPLILLYVFAVLGYLLLILYMMITEFEALPTGLYVSITTFIILVGPMMSLHLYDTISIH